ncbi:MAG: serine hydrolase domain-containing protein [Mariniblastus sp.]
MTQKISLWILATFVSIATFTFFIPDQVLAIQKSPDKDSANSEQNKNPIKEVIISDDAAELGFSVKKLESIDRKMNGLVRSEAVVGCSALVLKDGKEVYFGKWGYQNKRKKLPIDRQTIFRIYSMTKPITSIAAMQLVEQGKLDLDAPITTYLPEFAKLKVLDERGAKPVEVDPKRPMTTRDLMRHTSGLTYGFFGNTTVDKKYRESGVLMTDISIKSTVEKLANIPLLHHPGTRFHYSASTDVLGRVVEVVSGKQFDEYLKENVFQPLEMSDTFFSVPEEKQDRLAQLYAPKNGELKPASPLQSIRFVNEDNIYFSGGGGLCSTIDDYLKFSKMLLNKGELDGKRIVKEETIAQMFTNQLGKIEQSPGASFKFGLGFRCFPKGDYGWGGAAGTRFWVNPEKQLAIIYMMQTMPNRSKFAETVREATYSALR